MAWDIGHSHYLGYNTRDSEVTGRKINLGIQAFLAPRTLCLPVVSYKALIIMVLIEKTQIWRENCFEYSNIYLFNHCGAGICRNYR